MKTAEGFGSIAIALFGLALIIIPPFVGVFFAILIYTGEEPIDYGIVKIALCAFATFTGFGVIEVMKKIER